MQRLLITIERLHGLTSLQTLSIFKATVTTNSHYYVNFLPINATNQDNINQLYLFTVQYQQGICIPSCNNLITQAHAQLIDSWMIKDHSFTF